MRRDDIWITWKGMPRDIGIITTTIADLGCDYIDLYLIHFWTDDTSDNYKMLDILEEAIERKLIRHYGVSNCEKIEEIRKIQVKGYSIYANQIQARPPDGEIKNSISVMDKLFIENCNKLGVIVMLFGTISGVTSRYTMGEDYEAIISNIIPFINLYYLQKYIKGKPNVLMVGSTLTSTSIEGKSSLEINYENFNRVMKGKLVLHEGKIQKVEEYLQGICLSKM